MQRVKNGRAILKEIEAMLLGFKDDSDEAEKTKILNALKKAPKTWYRILGLDKAESRFKNFPLSAFKRELSRSIYKGRDQLDSAWKALERGEKFEIGNVKMTPAKLRQLDKDFSKLKPINKMLEE